MFNPRYASYTHFGLDHVATAWRAPRPHRPMPPRGAHPPSPPPRLRLGEALAEGEAHDAVGDAAKSMRVLTLTPTLTLALALTLTLTLT